MRVTETIKRDQVLGNIQRNAQKLQDLQLEMATGQRINKPSDDPLGATMAQDIVTNISKQRQRLANLADSISWLERSEIELIKINEFLDKAKRWSCHNRPVLRMKIHAMQQQVRSRISEMPYSMRVMLVLANCISSQESNH
jgi:hypothetical protein